MDWGNRSSTEIEHALAAWIAADGRVDKFEQIVGTSVPRSDVQAIARSMDAWVLRPDEEGFPAGVREKITTPGPWFIRGTLPVSPLIGVVGSRAVDHEGTRLCKAIVRDVAAAGVAIVSGGALGVDTLAHEAALGVQTPTVAILPSAFDCATPARNKRLFAKIAKAGALVSEYPPGVGAHRFHFHRRNRLIAAMCDAVLVVRAKVKSGSMITARAAQELGTPLLVVPGSPEDETAEGCNQLLREGARCVTCSGEVLEELGIAAAKAEPRQLRLDLSTDAQTLLGALDRPMSTDELCATCGLAPHVVLAKLTELELLAAVEAVGGRWRVK